MLLQGVSFCSLALIPFITASPAPFPQAPATGGDPGDITLGKGSCNSGEVAQIQSGRCKPGFLNTVFNVDVSEAVWNTIRAHNVTNFISFWMDGQETHPPPFKFTTMPTIKTETFTCARIPLALMTDDLGRAPAYVKAANPLFLGLYNEPDIPPGAPWKPTPAEEVGTNIKKVLDAVAQTPGSRTQFLAPGLFDNANQVNADPNGWWGKVKKTCPDCLANLPIISMHIYEGDAQKTIDIVNSVVQRYPDHKIWITELSPRSNAVDCKHTVPTIIEWMKTVLRELNKIDQVEKIFWNNGEWGEMGECNVSLTDANGNPTPLLTQLGDAGLCDVIPDPATS